MSTIDAPATTIPAGTYKDDGVHSAATFAVKHMVVSTFRGRFEDFSARLTVGEDGRAVLDGTVKADTIVVKDENLAAHLQSPEFFHAERHPQLRFSSSAIERDGERVTIDGELELKGTRRPVVLTGTATGTVDDPYGKERLGLRLETTVDRTEFGLNWNTPLPSGEQALANDVTLVADLAFVKEA
jgi:polyisoprenoid-binding protein YceI